MREVKEMDRRRCRRHRRVAIDAEIAHLSLRDAGEK